MNSQVSIIKCQGYNPAVVQQATRAAIDLIGGISNFIRPESKVLVKPNLLLAKAPEFGITTHPEVVRSVVKILKEINCRIFLGDGPNVWGSQIEDVDQVYALTGMREVCAEEGVELIKFDKKRMRKEIPLAACLDHCDYVVNIPKFKTHDFTILTGAIKNSFGLVSGTYKIELHKKYFALDDFSRMLVDVYAQVSPALTIVDGILAMEGDGPATGGKLRQQNLLLASADCVALDSILALIMGLEPLDISTTKEAARRGLGRADINSISLLGEKLEEVIDRPFLLPTTSLRRKLPQPIIKLAGKLIKFYPFVERHNCVRCSACIQACPADAITLKNERILIDYAKCISCFCCQEACPSAAIKVKKSILAKVIGL